MVAETSMKAAGSLSAKNRGLWKVTVAGGGLDNEGCGGDTAPPESPLSSSMCSSQAGREKRGESQAG